MTDPAFEAIDAAMQSLRSYRRDKLADRKRQARAAIAQTIDAWAAVQDDETFNRVMQASTSCSLASIRSASLGQLDADLFKKREYDSSDGLAIWLHTARAVTKTRVAPAIRDIWQHLMDVEPNADSMTQELIQDAGLPAEMGRRVPAGFAVED